MTINAHLHRLAAVIIVAGFVIALAVTAAANVTRADAPAHSPAQQPQATVAWLAHQNR